MVQVEITAFVWHNKKIKEAYEEKLSFFQYTVILFLCLIKMKINKEKETLTPKE